MRWTGLLSRRIRVGTHGRPEEMPGNAVRPEEVEIVPEGQEIVLGFREGVIARGRVVDLDGEPVAKTRVRIHAPKSILADTTTDEEGRFAPQAMPGVLHRFSEGFTDRRGRFFAHREGVLPEEVEVVLRLRPVLDTMERPPPR